MSITKIDQYKSVRSTVSKIELKSGDVLSQLNKISNEYYQVTLNAETPAKNQHNWSFVEKNLYNDAKSSYDEILAIYMQRPKVYRLNSVKEIIWNYNEKLIIKKEQEEQENRINSNRRFKSNKSKKIDSSKLLAQQLIKKRKEDDAYDDESNKISKDKIDSNDTDDFESYLDPFVVPKPWIVDVKNGKLSYYNPVSRERTKIKPGEIWKDKLQLLMKLTPRDDADGYEYKESDQERRRRMLLRTEYENKLKEEIKRRTNSPNDLEQIEDLLFDMIEEVAIKIDTENNLRKQNILSQTRSLWNIVTRGYRMKKLCLKNDDSSNDSLIKLTDYPFKNIMITNNCQVLCADFQSQLLLSSSLNRQNRIKINPFLSALDDLKNKFNSYIDRENMQKSLNEFKHLLNKIPLNFNSTTRNKDSSITFGNYYKMYSLFKERLSFGKLDSFKYKYKKDRIDLLFNEAVQSSKTSIKTLIKSPMNLSNDILNYFSSKKLEENINTTTRSKSFQVKLILRIDVPPIYVVEKKNNMLKSSNFLKSIGNRVTIETLPKLASKLNDNDYIKDFSHSNLLNIDKITQMFFNFGKKSKINKLLKSIHNEIDQMHSAFRKKKSSSTWEKDWNDCYNTNNNILSKLYKDNDSYVKMKNSMIDITSSKSDNSLDKNDNKESAISAESETNLDDFDELDISNYIFDSSRRKTFESELLQDLSHSLLLPTENFIIEEIRRLKYPTKQLLSSFENQINSDDLFLHNLEESIYLTKLHESLTESISNNDYSNFLFQDDIIEIIQEYALKFPNSNSIYELNLGDKAILEKIMGYPSNENSIDDSKLIIQNKRDLRKINKNKRNDLKFNDVDIGKLNPKKIMADKSHWLNKVKHSSNYKGTQSNDRKEYDVSLKAIHIRQLQLLVYEKSLQSKLTELERLKHLSSYHITNYIESVLNVFNPVVNEIAVNMSKMFNLEILKDATIFRRTFLSLKGIDTVNSNDKKLKNEVPQEIIDLLDDICNVIVANDSIAKDEMNIIKSDLNLGNISNVEVEPKIGIDSFLQRSKHSSFIDSLQSKLKDNLNAVASEKLELEQRFQKQLSIVASEIENHESFENNDKNLDLEISSTLNAIIMTIEQVHDNKQLISNTDLNQLNLKESNLRNIDFLFSIYRIYRDKLEETKLENAQILNHISIDKSEMSFFNKSYCEINLNVMVTHADKLSLKLPELDTSDIIKLLFFQFNNPTSIFRNGVISRYVVDMKVKDEINEQRKVFPDWETYWVNFIHPVFFGYSVNSKVSSKSSNDKNYSNEIIQLENSTELDKEEEEKNNITNRDNMNEFKDSLNQPMTEIPKNSKISLNVFDPKTSFTERTRLYYLSLERKNKDLLATQKRVRKQKEKQRKMKLLIELNKDKQQDDPNDLTDQPKNNKSDDQSVSSNDSEDIADDDNTKLEYFYDKTGRKILKFFKPRMNKLMSFADIIKLKKIYKEYDRLYQKACQRKNVDKSIIVGSTNIPLYLYTATRNRDLAYHYYYIGKSKYDQQQLLNNITQSKKIEVYTSNTADSEMSKFIYDDSLDDITSHLQSIRQIKQDNKYKVKKNKFIQLQNYKIKNWLIEKFISLQSDNLKKLVSQIVYNYLITFDAIDEQIISNDDINTEKYQDQFRHQQFLSISEEKKTRSLFNFVKLWINGYLTVINYDTNTEDNDDYFNLPTKTLYSKFMNKNVDEKVNNIDQKKFEVTNNAIPSSTNESSDTVLKKDFWDFLDIVFVSIDEYNERILYESYKKDLLQVKRFQENRRKSIDSAVKLDENIAGLTVLRKTSISMNQRKNSDSHENTSAFEFIPASSLEKISPVAEFELPLDEIPQVLSRRPTVFENMSRQPSTNRRASLSNNFSRPTTSNSISLQYNNLNSSFEIGAASELNAQIKFSRAGSIDKSLLDQHDQLSHVDKKALNTMSNNIISYDFTYDPSLQRKTSLQESNTSLRHSDSISFAGYTSESAKYRETLAYPVSSIDTKPINTLNQNHHIVDVLKKTASLSVKPPVQMLHSLYNNNKGIAENKSSSFSDNFKVLSNSFSNEIDSNSQPDYRRYSYNAFNNKKSSKDFSSIEKKYLERKIKLDKVPIHKRLRDVDIVKLKNIQWLVILNKYPSLLTCFKQLPTIIGTSYSNNEVIQFAILLVKLSPMFAEVFEKVSSDNEKSEQFVNIMEESNLTSTQTSVTIPSTIKEEIVIPDNSEINQENVVTMSTYTEDKQIKIASSATMKSHNHKYIKFPNSESAFCILCKQYDVEEWIENQINQELSHKSNFDTVIKDIHNKLGLITVTVRAEYKDKNNIYGNRNNNVSDKDRQRISERYNKYINSLRYEVGSRGLSNIDNTKVNPETFLLPEYIIRSGISFVDPKGKVIIPIESQNSKIVQVIESSGVIESMNELPIDVYENSSMIDANKNGTYGLKIRLWNYENEVRGKYLGEIVLNESDLTNPPKGRRMYYLTCDNRCLPSELENQVVFRGSITIRITIIKSDKETNIPLLWKLVILSASNLQQEYIKSVVSPYCEVLWFGPVEKPILLHQSFLISKTYDDTKLDGKDNYIEMSKYQYNWIRFGNTKPKYRTADPTFGVIDDNTFEFPPCFTDYPLINRIDRKKLNYIHGGWIARNCIPELTQELTKVILERDDEEKRKNIFTNNLSNSSQNSKNKTSFTHNIFLENTIDAEMSKSTVIETNSNKLDITDTSILKESEKSSQHSNDQSLLDDDKNSKMQIKRKFLRAIKYIIKSNMFNEIVEEEAKIRLNVEKYLTISQENERQCMSSEDIEKHRYDLEEELEVSKSFLHIQEMYYKEYAMIIQHIIYPSKILTRLSFMMASTVEGGGLNVICQDPTSHKLCEVLAVPILYPEDEQMLLAQITSLLEISCPYIVKVIDCGIYQVRRFTSTGFMGVNDRISIVVVEKYDGNISILEYMRRYDITNEELKLILLQIVIGLEKLHEKNIIHRNLNPDSIILELPNGYEKKPYFLQKNYSVDTTSYLSNNLDLSNFISKTKRKLRKEVQRNRVLCRIGGFWFFQNPRKPGCEYSYGRVDWGNQQTIPPEVINGYKMSNKADIYAFGVCIFYWVTNGKALPDLAGKDIDILKPFIPFKWGPWLMTLLNMCLQRNPHNRASTRELQAFLRLKSN